MAKLTSERIPLNDIEQAVYKDNSDTVNDIDNSTCLRNTPTGNKRHFLYQPGYEYKYSPHQKKKRYVPIPFGTRIKEIVTEIKEKL